MPLFASVAAKNYKKESGAYIDKIYSGYNSNIEWVLRKIVKKAMVIFSTNKKNTEKYGKKNCLQEGDDGIKYICGDIYVKKNVSRRFMTLVMTPALL